MGEKCLSLFICWIQCQFEIKTFLERKKRRWTMMSTIPTNVKGCCWVHNFGGWSTRRRSLREQWRAFHWPSRDILPVPSQNDLHSRRIQLVFPSIANCPKSQGRMKKRTDGQCGDREKEHVVGTRTKVACKQCCRDVSTNIFIDRRT